MFIKPPVAKPTTPHTAVTHQTTSPTPIKSIITYHKVVFTFFADACSTIYPSQVCCMGKKPLCMGMPTRSALSASMFDQNGSGFSASLIRPWDEELRVVMIQPAESTPYDW